MVSWAGNGTTVSKGSRTLTNTQCGTQGTPYLYWVLSGSKAASATLTVGTTGTFDMGKPQVDRLGYSTFKYIWTPASTIDLGAVFNSGVFATLSASKTKGVLAVSHGCLGILNPTFDTPVSTADGFTVNLTNYNPAFTYSPKVSAGTAGSSGTITPGTPRGSILPLTVTGLRPGESATITVGTTRKGYANGTGTVTGTAKDTRLGSYTPAFDTPASTADGFTVNVTNYDSAFTYAPTVSKGTVTPTVVNGKLVLTVTGLDAGESATITLGATRPGYADGSGSATGTAEGGTSALTLHFSGQFLGGVLSGLGSDQSATFCEAGSTGNCVTFDPGAPTGQEKQLALNGSSSALIVTSTGIGMCELDIWPSNPSEGEILYGIRPNDVPLWYFVPNGDPLTETTTPTWSNGETLYWSTSNAC